MNRKNNLRTIFLLLVAVAFASCNKEDHNAKKLCNHDGVWTIDKVTIQNFDSTGTKTLDSIITNVGEMVFMKSTSLQALYGYRQAVFLLTDTLGTHGYFFEYVFDGNRINIQSCQAPFAINGTYTSVIDKKNEQQWEIYGAGYANTGATSLSGKFILHLKRKNV